MSKNDAFIRSASILVLIAQYLPQAVSQCSGSALVLTATETYQYFTSLNYPNSYSNNLDCLWRMEASNSSWAVRLEITEASIEYHADCVYDTGEVYDGYNASAASMGRFCGTSLPTHVSAADLISVTFTSDYSLTSTGFRARYKAGERSTLLDDEEEASNFNTVVILGASIGAVVFIILIMAVVFTYVQAKKAKRIRRNPHLRRRVSHSRVQPFGADYGTDFWLPPAPPAYGEIYSSPMSPPPLYSEQDPNPNNTEPLPGRAEYMGPPTDPHTQQSVINPIYDPNFDSIANTHFIRPIHLQNMSNQSSSTTSPREINTENTSSRNIPPTRQNIPSNAGALAALNLLRPSSFRSNADSTNTNTRVSSRNHSCLTINIPEHQSNLPNSVIDSSAAGGSLVAAASTSGALNNVPTRNASQNSHNVQATIHQTGNAIPVGNTSGHTNVPEVEIEASSPTVSEISLPDDRSLSTLSGSTNLSQY